MRSQTVLSALVLSLSAIAACSAQSESTPPRGTGATAGTVSSSGGTTSASGGTTSTGFSGSTSVAGTGTGFGGAPGGAGTGTGFGGAPPAAGGTTAGTAGSPPVGGTCTSTVVGTGSSGLIDDFEGHTAGSALLPATNGDGRVGGWGIDHSTTAMMMATASTAIPVAGGNPGMALHFAGTDNITATPPGWGADAAVAIAGPGGCYDASAYHGGLSLSLKSGSGATSVVVSLQTAEVLATNYASGPNGKMVAITGSWADYVIPYTDLMTTYGTPVPLDLKSVHAVVIATSASGAASFDVWVDNLKFLP